MTTEMEDIWDQLCPLLVRRGTDSEGAYRGVVALFGTHLSSDLPLGKREVLMQELASTQSLFGRTDEASHTVNSLIGLFPNSVLSLSYASSFFVYNVYSPDIAVDFAQRAVEQAMHDHHLENYALNTLCRVARQANRFDVLQVGIELVLARESVRGETLGRIECDYVKDLPPNALPASLVKELIDRCESQPGCKDP